jgi:hypothetical protein
MKHGHTTVVCDSLRVNSSVHTAVLPWRRYGQVKWLMSVLKWSAHPNRVYTRGNGRCALQLGFTLVVRMAELCLLLIKVGDTLRAWGVPQSCLRACRTQYWNCVLDGNKPTIIDEQADSLNFCAECFKCELVCEFHLRFSLLVVGPLLFVRHTLHCQSRLSTRDFWN